VSYNSISEKDQVKRSEKLLLKIASLDNTTNYNETDIPNYTTNRRNSVIPILTLIITFLTLWGIVQLAESISLYRKNKTRRNQEIKTITEPTRGFLVTHL
jgi:hypothetical protein